MLLGHARTIDFLLLELLPGPKWNTSVADG
jgi:hypothetical protein